MSRAHRSVVSLIRVVLNAESIPDAAAVHYPADLLTQPATLSFPDIIKEFDVSCVCRCCYTPQTLFVIDPVGQSSPLYAPAFACSPKCVVQVEGVSRVKEQQLNTALGEHVNVCVNCCLLAQEWIVQHISDPENKHSLITYVSQINMFYDVLTTLKEDEFPTPNWKNRCHMEMLRYLLLYGFCRLEDLYCFYSNYMKSNKSIAAKELIRHLKNLNISDISLLANSQPIYKNEQYVNISALIVVNKGYTYNTYLSRVSNQLLFNQHMVNYY